jgi:hypothetical protein
MPRKYPNRWFTTLADVGGITNVATSLTLAANPGSVSLTAGQYVVLTVTNGSTVERMRATTITGTAVSGITRGQEGTTGVAFPLGATISINITQVGIENLFDLTEGQYLTEQTTNLTATAGKLGVQARMWAGRMMLQIRGPSGAQTYKQPHFGENSISLWQPAGNSTTITAIGAAALTATGTATAANVATTNRHTYMKRLEYLVTVAATTAVAGFREGVAQRTVGGPAAGDGGFFFCCRWGPATGVATTTNRAWVGMSSSTAAPTDVEPSTITNSVGMGWDAADTNIQMMHRGAGAVTKIDLGASFPVPTADRTKAYEIALFSPPGTTQTVGYYVTDLATGAVASGTISTNMPTNTTLLAARGWMSVGGTSSVIGIALMGLYLETDY